MNDLQQKMYNHVETPPPGAWEKIAASLDESHLDSKFPKTLFTAQAIPPPSAWEAISSTLTELNLSNQFPATLYNAEALPPANAWEKIQSALDTKTPTATVVPFRRVMVRYAAIAAILVLIAFATVRIQGSSETAQPGMAKNNNSQKQTPATKQETATVKPEKNTNSEIAITTQEAAEDAALENSKHTYASLDGADKKRMKKVSDEFFKTPAYPIVASANFNPANTYEELDCAEVNTPSFASTNSGMDISGRYAMLMSPDGHIIRISKKLGKLVCCVSGEEEDDACTDQMNKWRKKIANSPVTPSPGNFMDILDLLHTLKENNL